MADLMADTFVTVDEDGNVGADFTGRVHAKGLILDIGDGTLLDFNDTSVRWQAPGSADPVDIDQLPAYILANDADNPELDLAAKSQLNPGHATSSIKARGAGADARLEAFADDGGPSFVRALIDGLQRIIFRDDEASDFLQLIDAAKLRIDFGRATIPASGAPTSQLLNVAHQLAVTPQLIVLSPTGSSGQFAATWGGLTPDGFDIHLRNVTGANIAGTVKVDWIVLG